MTHVFVRGAVLDRIVAHRGTMFFISALPRPATDDKSDLPPMPEAGRARAVGRAFRLDAAVAGSGAF